jgi:hypothetical protein
MTTRLFTCISRSASCYRISTNVCPSSDKPPPSLQHSHNKTLQTEHDGWRNKLSVSSSGSTRFETHPEHRLSWDLLFSSGSRNKSWYSTLNCRSHWTCGLRRRSAAARLLRLWVRIPPGAWMSVCCDCCVLSGRGLCYELITHPEEPYRLWCVVLCDLETSWPFCGLLRQNQTNKTLN